jgi:predicted outer membrane repeat protein
MSGKSGPDIIESGLVLCLDAANKNSYRGSGTTWTDLSGNSNNGTLTNGPTFSAGNMGSILFDGTNDYVDTVNTGTTFQFANVTFTVSLWIKTTSSTGGVIISKGATASTAGWLFQFDSSGTVSGTTKGSDGINTYNRSSTATVNNNTWRNIVSVYTTNTTTLGSNTTSIYIDGVLSNGTGTLGGAVYATTTDTIQIGRRPTGAYWSGSVSNIQIYNRALSATEILQNYNATKSRFGR